MVTPSLVYPQSPPVALGGTTSAAQVTAARGVLAAQVLRGSAVYQLLRWNTGVASWERVLVNSLPVSCEPIAGSADGTASTFFDAVPSSYYTALLTTSQPADDPANLLALDIQNAARRAADPVIVGLGGDVDGPSNTNTVRRVLNLPVSWAGRAAGNVLVINSTNDGIETTPAVPGGVSSVTFQAPLTNAGTAQDPVGAITPGTVVGQVLRWNGTQWEPALLFQNPTTSVPTPATLTTSNTPVLVAAARLGLVIYNKSTDTIAIIVLGSSAVDGTQMYPINPQSQWTDTTGWQGPVTGFTESGSADIVATELFA